MGVLQLENKPFGTYCPALIRGRELGTDAFDDPTQCYDVLLAVDHPCGDRSTF